MSSYDSDNLLEKVKDCTFRKPQQCPSGALFIWAMSKKMKPNQAMGGQKLSVEYLVFLCHSSH